MKPSGIGGMAVIEGVMMKNKDEYAVAVRKPNNEIVIEKNTHKDLSDKVKLFKLPVFRGMMAFVDSMVIGIKVLNFSSSFFEEEENETQKKDIKADNKKNKRNKNEEKDYVNEDLSITESKDSKTITNEPNVEIDINEVKKDSKEEQSNALLMVLAVLLSIVISVALFMVLPVFLANLFSKITASHILLALIEGIIRLVIFIGYILFASMMPDIKRVFMYHGAEHKTINCMEHGVELTVENVKRHSKQHKRCGTSFMLLVMLISLVFFIFIPTGNLIWRFASRIILVPIIAGVSYEFIRLAGKSENILVNILSKPGLWLQGLTTREPDDSMIEVAICSVDAVFDWKSFVNNSNIKENDNKVVKNSKVKHEINHSKDEKEVKASETVKSLKPRATLEEDDEILKALDRYLDFDEKKASGTENKR